jgi:hypothetical protein
MRRSPLFATVVPFPAAPRTFGRRPLSSVVGHLTCLMLFKHGETASDVLVSDDGDAVGAVSLPKALISIAAPDRGRFLVVTLPAKLARDKGLSTPIIDRDGFTPDELAELNDAIATSKRTRDRLVGHVQPIGWSGGRNVFA